MAQARSRSDDIAVYIARFEEMAGRARRYMDTGHTHGWKASELLRVGFYALLTGPHPERSATFANDMLAEARQLWRAGRVANPFFGQPVE